MFTLDAISRLRRRDTATPATDIAKSSPVEAATPATPATNVAIVAMSHVAGQPDPRLQQPAFRRAVIAAREAADFPRFENALRAGNLMLCCNCPHFAFSDDPAQLGQCARFTVDAWPFVAFECAGYERAAQPVAPKYLPEPP
jgi:hypothetical protein